MARTIRLTRRQLHERLQHEIELTEGAVDVAEKLHDMLRAAIKDHKKAPQFVKAMKRAGFEKDAIRKMVDIWSDGNPVEMVAYLRDETCNHLGVRPTTTGSGGVEGCDPQRKKGQRAQKRAKVGGAIRKGGQALKALGVKAKRKIKGESLLREAGARPIPRLEDVDDYWPGALDAMLEDPAMMMTDRDLRNQTFAVIGSHDLVTIDPETDSHVIHWDGEDWVPWEGDESSARRALGENQLRVRDLRRVIRETLLQEGYGSTDNEENGASK